MIKLRRIELNDLEEYQYWKSPKHTYHALNGPYFRKSSEEDIEEYMKRIRFEFENGYRDPIYMKRLISNDENQMLGEVSWTWRSKETLWMEIGIVIFDEVYWGKGIGYDALKLWISELFQTNPKIVRLGLTTWSGNLGMMRLAEKLGLQKEAEYRKARIVKGKYFDSISYGVLREEWESFVNGKR